MFRYGIRVTQNDTRYKLCETSGVDKKHKNKRRKATIEKEGEHDSRERLPRHAARANLCALIENATRYRSRK